MSCMQEMIAEILHPKSKHALTAPETETADVEKLLRLLEQKHLSDCPIGKMNAYRFENTTSGNSIVN